MTDVSSNSMLSVSSYSAISLSGSTRTSLCMTPTFGHREDLDDDRRVVAGHRREVDSSRMACRGASHRCTRRPPALCVQVKPLSAVGDSGRSCPAGRVSRTLDPGRVLRAGVVDGDRVGLGPARRDRVEAGAAVVLTMVRSMPVAMVVDSTAMLLVSSDSKTELLGSTVTVFVIVPSVAGATRTMVIVSVCPAPRFAMMQVTMPRGLVAQRARRRRRR